VLDLPPGAQILATSDLDPCHGIRFAPRAWGVQYHPEFTAPVMSKYIELRGEALLREGFDPAALQTEVSLTAQASALLPRFVTLTRESM
jgi:GMP synthase (glutamine-hydrolysing)